MEHLEKNEILVNEQFGFLPNRSSQLQLMRVLDDFTKTIDSRRETDVIYLDFKKAFDSVPLKRLIGILKQYGIKGLTLGWINEFLLTRRKRVVINNSRSEWKDFLSGIPQESLLGPVLIVIYINSMPNKVKSKLYLIADDAKLYREISSNQDVELLQEDLRKLEEWSKIVFCISMKISVYI